MLGILEEAITVSSIAKVQPGMHHPCSMHLPDSTCMAVPADSGSPSQAGVCGSASVSSCTVSAEELYWYAVSRAAYVYAPAGAFC